MHPGINSSPNFYSNVFNLHNLKPQNKPEIIPIYFCCAFSQSFIFYESIWIWTDISAIRKMSTESSKKLITKLRLSPIMQVKKVWSIKEIGKVLMMTLEKLLIGLDHHELGQSVHKFYSLMMGGRVRLIFIELNYHHLYSYR